MTDAQFVFILNHLKDDILDEIHKKSIHVEYDDFVYVREYDIYTIIKNMFNKLTEPLE